MSRIGKLPINILPDITIKCETSTLKIKGQFGELSLLIPNSILIQQVNKTLILSPNIKNRNSYALQGLFRSLINNMIIGVSKQFTITLVLIGVGYRGSIKDKTLILNLGYSHQIQMSIPSTISLEIIKNTTLILKSCDKQQLGLFASQIRNWRPPEPYKGKGILFKDEIIKRKAGKSGKK